MKPIIKLFSNSNRAYECVKLVSIEEKNKLISLNQQNVETDFVDSSKPIILLIRLNYA